ncbi:hypothetical protein CI238_08029 [Colletotrichum incanum]|uniref:Uncharacterized protein n=1 Tax=Colletotrichum incanum TaxID=1573173 RepID=A0A167E873_COLIC|nr:hypothetical protein CI238_08029 [Colletotrichum incanum]
MMKSACAARIEREHEQSIDYANATYNAHSLPQSNASGTHSTDVKGSDFNDEHGSGSHVHICWATLGPADGYDLGWGGENGAYDGAWQASDVDINAMGLDNTSLVIGTCGHNAYHASSSSNGTHHDETPDHNAHTDELQSSGVFSRDTSDKDPYPTLTDMTWIRPSTSLSHNSGQPHGASDAFSPGPFASSCHANNAETASTRTLTYKTAATSPTAKPPQRRNLHGNWRQRDAAPVTSFGDSVLADIAKEQEQPKQPTLLERLGHSLSDPEPWQVELHQQKSRLLSTPTAVERSLAEDTLLQHGLFQELNKKYGDTWPKADDEDEQSTNSSTPTFERGGLSAQGEQNVPTKRKTLLEIYYEAEKETALRNQGLSQWLQFGDMTAVEIPTSNLA